MFKRFFVCFRSIYCNFFAVDNRRAYARHIVMVTLYILLSSVFVAKAVPSTVEEYTFIPGEKVFKFLDGDLHFGVYRTQDSINFTNIFRPIRRKGVEARQYIKNFGIEFSRSSGTAGVAGSHISEVTINKDNRQSTSNTKKPQVKGSKYDSKKVHPSVFLLLISGFVCAFCDPLGMFIKWSKKHNATKWLSYEINIFFFVNGYFYS